MVAKLLAKLELWLRNELIVPPLPELASAPRMPADCCEFLMEVTVLAIQSVPLPALDSEL